MDEIDVDKMSPLESCCCWHFLFYFDLRSELARGGLADCDWRNLHVCHDNECQM